MNDERESFHELEGTTEDENDYGSISQSEISGVAIATTDWTTETILNQLKKGNINLNPRFQRRDAWDPQRKSQFIESLILGLPVPQIVLAERANEKGTYVVLDGKQRLLCLRQFAANPDDLDFKRFKLSNLVVRKELNGKTFEDLTNDFHFKRDLTALENYGVRAVILRNWKTEKLLGHVFLRLNMGSKPLSPQELRQALHPGPFLDFADEASSRSTAIRQILGSDKPDFRMRDIELVIRYLSFRHFLESYRGNLKDFLDNACQDFNSSWDLLHEQLSDEILELDRNAKAIREAFGEKYNFGKWSGGKFETRFNRAVFDILTQSLTYQDVSASVSRDPKPFVESFRRLCATDPKFLEAIERTTKSLEATAYRFSSWYAEIGRAYDINVSPPIFHHLP